MKHFRILGCGEGLCIDAKLRCGNCEDKDYKTPGLSVKFLPEGTRVQSNEIIYLNTDYSEFNPMHHMRKLYGKKNS